MKKKIIWPVDPTNSFEPLEKKMSHFFKVFAQIEDCVIQPVYVLSVDYFLTSEYFEPVDTSGLKQNMVRVCDDYLKKFADLNLQPTVILENTFSALGAEVRTFCDYVSEEKPDFVVLSTHGRSGWSRAFLGSFAESFLLQTKTPTILIGPECQAIESARRALMPVQLNDSSKQFVEKFLDDHRLAFLEQLTLFHKISMIDMEEIVWAPTLYGLDGFSSQDLLNKAKLNTSNYLTALQEHPLSEKRLNHYISEELGPVSDIIVKEIKQGDFDLVVMRTEAGTFEANVLGSVTREVVRHSTKPVIVYPHQFES